MMNMRPNHVVELSPERRFLLNILDLPRPAHPMFGLLEVDVTVVRKFIAEHKTHSGETLSFTGFLAFCLARAVEENKAVQSYRKGAGKFLWFDEVDVGLMIEKQVGDKKVISGHVIKNASTKTYREIHEEIRLAQSPSVDTSKQVPAWFLRAILLPWPISKLVRLLLSWVIRMNPALPVSMTGTVGITAVGMFAKGHSGWGFETTQHSLDLVVGSIAWKPTVIEGVIVPREILNLTVVLNHEVIDGGPAARFTRRLVELIETGFGLQEEQFAP
jgi:pyruvate/2-oxoglutarate dehydrogenase complex dihydrolipoamide acyltransferase (E2) component